MQVGSDPGLWADRHDPARRWPDRPMLFLDRDGVVIAEANYLGHPDGVRMLPGIADAIARVNARDIPVVLVTNQSGIARGLFGWLDFSAVQARIDAILRATGARLDLVLACAHHAAGGAGLAHPDHPWRKPNPGMLLHARDLLGADLRLAHIVGDRDSDLEAGIRAGLPAGTLVMSGYGRGEAARVEEKALARRQAGFATCFAHTGSDAITHWLS